VPGLPTTGRDTEPLLVAALVAMIAGLALVARTRRFLD
jgi:LPXTG-motif cell wall-anchored protein